MRWRKSNGDVDLTAARNNLAALHDRVQPDFRRAILYGTLPIIALIVGNGYGNVHSDSIARRWTVWGCALAILVFGVIATQAAANELRRVVAPRAGLAAASSLRIAALLIGYSIAVLFTLDVLDVPLRNLLVGLGATGIVLGIAAQQSLGNLFAGLVLLFARPYVPGQRIKVYAGALGGPHIGTVSSVGLLYTSLDTAEGLINIPNGGLLASAVGPAPDEPAEHDETTAEEREAATAPIPPPSAEL